MTLDIAPKDLTAGVGLGTPLNLQAQLMRQQSMIVAFLVRLAHTDIKSVVQGRSDSCVDLEHFISEMDNAALLRSQEYGTIWLAAQLTDVRRRFGYTQASNNSVYFGCWDIAFVPKGESSKNCLPSSGIAHCSLVEIGKLLGQAIRHQGSYCTDDMKISYELLPLLISFQQCGLSQQVYKPWKARGCRSQCVCCSTVKLDVHPIVLELLHGPVDNLSQFLMRHAGDSYRNCNTL